MKQLCHERAESIALTFTQNPTAPRRMDDNDDDKNSNLNSGSNTIMPPIFGAEGMREPQLEPSILGSIVPTLDPDPPRPACKDRISLIFKSDSTVNSSNANSNALVTANDYDTPEARRLPAAPGSKRPFPTESMPDGEAFPAEEGPREWAGGGGGHSRVAGTAAAAGVAEARAGTAGQRVDAPRTRGHRAKNGLRVLVRGASRSGKTAILWDYCHRAAMVGHRVVLVCLRAANDAEGFTVLPRSMRAGAGRGDSDELQGWEASALGRIGIKYVHSRDDLAWYLASLHTLKRAQWPTVIAVDDVDKIIEASAGGGGGSGGLGAAALRILALLQDTAEFFDNARAEMCAEGSGTGADGAGATPAGAKAFAESDRSARETPSKTTVTTPRAKGEGSGSGVDGGTAAGTATPQPPPSGNLEVGSPEVEEGERGFAPRAWGTRRTGVGPRGVGQEEAVAVRVVSTCSTSDRGLLSLYGRFVHVVARVQNTTGPDCFSLKVEPGTGTGSQLFSGPHARPAGGFAPGFTPWDGNSHGANADTGDRGSSRAGADGLTARLEVVEFVRSQLDGSFALF